jgi:hypothetical protein
MATKLDPIIYGSDKSINYSKVSVGELAKAVSEDLEEFGEKGVQGVKLASNLSNFLTYEKAGKRAKEPYFQLGVASSGSLVLLLLDKKDPKFEAMEMAVKGYKALKEKLAASSAKVVNISHDKEEDIIKGASAAQADKFKTAVSNDDNPDFGGITGNVILCAHGRPDVVPSGRVIGDQFGPRTPEQIVDLLTGDKSAAKRIGKDFNGKVTLSGCFTASGGPEGSKQDDPFAAKVLALLRKKGYAKLSVVGMPGPSITAREDGEKDSQGTAMKRGDKRVQVNAPTGKDLDKLDRLEAEEEKLSEDLSAKVKAYNLLMPPRNNANDAHKALVKEFGDAKKASKLKPDEFMADPKTIELGKKIAAAKKIFDDLEAGRVDSKKEYDASKAAFDAKVKEIKDSGLRDTMAKVTGSFGLRELN